MNAAGIARLKKQLKSAVLNYRAARNRADLGCGANLAAVINTNVYATAKRVNAIAAELKAADPNFPASWVPYPEGT